VSPGGATDSTLVEARCPTFSWAGSVGAAGYRLAVLRVGLDEQPEPQEPEMVALIDLPADSRSFTPPVGRCLDRGERYAWSVAAVAGEDEPVHWSPLFLFEIEAGREPDDAVSLQQAVEVLERYLSGQGTRHGIRRGSEAAPAPSEAGAGDRPRREPTHPDRRARAEEEHAEEREATSEMSVRVAAAAAPTPGAVSLNVSNQVHLAPASAVFKGGEAFLWDDTTGNTALGREALESVSTGTRNTAVGRQALRNTTGGTSFGGSLNTAVGDLALLANNSGKRNTATGSDALGANTTGSGNTAIGASALLNNAIGTYNVATGAFALRNNTDGNSNTAVGYYALRANTEGNWNTAVGAHALRVNTAGDFNTAIGLEALRSSTQGRQTAIGARALRSSTTGDKNTALGFHALYDSVSGVRNTAVGYLALANNTGNGNIAVGYGAGVSSVTGSDNIFIGQFGESGDDETIRIGAGQERAFIAGIRGKTTAGSAISVLIDSDGQLGTVSSSRRTKQDIRGAEPFLDRLLELRPVAFRYRQQVASDPNAPLEFGLIAEEVADVFPELVVFDRDGRPETVRYHLLSSLLLAELKRQRDLLVHLQVQNEASASRSPRECRRRRCGARNGAELIDD
jgi:hypothetical protein